MNRNDQDFIVQKIRTYYTEKTATVLVELKALDAKVKRPANVFAWALGCISAVIMGSGRSLVMTELGKALGLGGGAAMIVGIAAGLAGIVLVSLAYPVYCRILKKKREKLAPEIIRLTDELMK